MSELRTYEEKLSDVQIQTLIRTAIAQLSYAYTPYSNFRGCAALLAKIGKVYGG